MPKWLLTDDGMDLSDFGTNALIEIFHRYDRTKKGVLTDKELNEYSMACNGIPFEEFTLVEIKENFSTDDQENLTLEGFLDMYSLQTAASPEETWKDLQKHGYTNPEEALYEQSKSANSGKDATINKEKENS